MADLRTEASERRDVVVKRFLQLLRDMEELGLIAHQKGSEPKPILRADLNGSSFVLAQVDSRRLVSLTPRQRQVGQHVGEGRGDKGIARLLKLKVGTVSNQLKKVREKLGVRSRACVARYSLWLCDL